MILGGEEDDELRHKKKKKNVMNCLGPLVDPS